MLVELSQNESKAGRDTFIAVMAELGRRAKVGLGNCSTAPHRAPRPYRGPFWVCRRWCTVISGGQLRRTGTMDDPAPAEV